MDQAKELMRNTHIAAPCSVKWEDMTGDDRARLCAQCNLHVVNTFMLTDEEVLAALTRIHQGERICMRIYKRADGTFMTRNCPVGLQKIKERAFKVAAWIAGGLSVMLSLAASAAPPSITKAVKKKPTWHAKVSATGCEQKQKGKSKQAGTTVKTPDWATMPTAGLPAPYVPPLPPATKTETPDNPATISPDDVLKGKGVVQVKPVPAPANTTESTTTAPDATAPDDVLKSKGVVEIKPAPPKDK